MITVEEIARKAARVLPRAIKAWLADDLQSFFPYRMPANLTIANDHAAAIAEVDKLRHSAKQATGDGYSIVWKPRRSRTHGLNHFPDKIIIESMEDLVHLCEQESQWSQLQAAVETLRRRQPILNGWLCKGANWKTLLESADSLDDLMGLVDFFVEHPRPDCFAREIPLAVSTKLIETHRRQLATWLDLVLQPSAIDVRFGFEDFEARYGLRYARPHYLLRVLDPGLLTELGLPFEELSLPAESLSKLIVRGVRIIMVENKVNLLTLPRLPRTLALGGLGYAVTQLTAVSWLYENAVHYWGDLDADGFVILDRLRSQLPDVKSILMTEDVLQQFAELATPGNGAVKKSLQHLLDSERSCYELLCETNRRIEQEHLPHAACVTALANLLR